MGCVSSDRKDPSTNQRSRMLIEYIKGIEAKPVKEIKVLANLDLYDVPPNLNEGDIFMAGDSSQFKIISSNIDTKNLLCLNCTIKLNQRKIADHMNSKLHLDSL
jgi:hypothetical protein